MATENNSRWHERLSKLASLQQNRDKVVSDYQKWSSSLLKESDLRSKNMYPGKTKHLFLTVSLKLNLNCSKQIQEDYLHASSIFADASSVAAKCTHDMHEVRSRSQTVNQKSKGCFMAVKSRWGHCKNRVDKVSVRDPLLCCHKRDISDGPRLSRAVCSTISTRDKPPKF